MTFPWPTPGTPLSEVATPMPVIDEARMEANIARAQSCMDAHGLRFRPHIKTHKIPFVARAQRIVAAPGLRLKGYAVVACEVRPAIGDVLHVVPNHTCPASNLFDRVVVHRNGIVTRTEAVAARGMVR